MSDVGKLERATQNLVVRLFRDKLHYDYLGNWEDRKNNRNIETEYLTAWLQRQAVRDSLITRALRDLENAAEKDRVLSVLKPHIFFDVQKSHLLFRDDNIPMVHIPFGIANQ